MYAPVTVFPRPRASEARAAAPEFEEQHLPWLGITRSRAFGHALLHRYRAITVTSSI